MSLFGKLISEEKRKARVKNRRVHMANERTFLAWIRTCIGIMIFGFVIDAESKFEAHLFPAMYYTEIALGSFLKGIGLDQLWGNALVLTLYAAVLWTLSYLLFHKRPRS